MTFTSPRKGRTNVKTSAVFAEVFCNIRKHIIHFENYPGPAPTPSSRFGTANEVKERLHCQALQWIGCPNADVATGRGGFSPPALVGAGQGARFSYKRIPSII